MKLYVEEIFLFNFLLDYMILYGTKRLLKRVCRHSKLILSALIGAMTTFILFFNISTFFLFFLKIILSIVMIQIAFGKQNRRENLFYFYMISISIGGVFYLTNLWILKHTRFLLLLGIGYFVYKILQKEKRHYTNHVMYRYIVEIEYQKQKYKIEGFLDTGNQLVSPFKKEPVILIDFLIPSKKILYIPFQTLNERGVLPCIRPDKVRINKKEFSNCFIGFAKEKFQLEGANCILPNAWKEDLC